MSDEGAGSRDYRNTYKGWWNMFFVQGNAMQNIWLKWDECASS